MILLRRVLTILVLLALIVGGSFLANRLWGGKSEEAETVAFEILPGETVGAIAKRLHLEEKAVRRYLGAQLPAQADLPLTDLPLDPPALHTALRQALALSSDSASKNWFKIPLKFALWIGVILLGTVWVRKGVFHGRRRIALYAASAFVFGVVLGSDPSPMGPLKDGITLYGLHGIIFRPRVVAFLLFSAMVLIVNKSVCAWGCQFGVLQDLLFRTLRGDGTPAVPQIRLPFKLSNAVRALVFLALCLGALVWSFDLIGPVDPFKLYHPGMLAAGGIVLLALLLLGALVFYRPWCQLACPFGFVGWVIEQFSLLRVRVDKDTCIDCGACVKACPTEAMHGILKNATVRADCFACGSCQPACPVDAIHFGRKAAPHKATPHSVTGTVNTKDPE